jgi:hypothetical protein
MSDKVQALVVIFDQDVSTDYADKIGDWVLHIKGVSSVVSEVANLSDLVARERARSELKQRIWDALWGD